MYFAVAVAICRDEACKPKYMTPDEVEGHMRQLCYQESGILQHLFGGDKPSPAAAADGAAQPLPQSRHKRKQQKQQQVVEKALERLRQWRLQQHYRVLREIHPELSAAAEEGLAAQRRRARKGIAAAARAGPAEMYKAFFLRALAVPPNRLVGCWHRGCLWTAAGGIRPQGVAMSLAPVASAVDCIY